MLPRRRKEVPHQPVLLPIALVRVERHDGQHDGPAEALGRREPAHVAPAYGPFELARHRLEHGLREDNRAGNAEDVDIGVGAVAVGPCAGNGVDEGAAEDGGMPSCPE